MRGVWLRTVRVCGVTDRGSGQEGEAERGGELCSRLKYSRVQGAQVLHSSRGGGEEAGDVAASRLCWALPTVERTWMRLKGSASLRGRILS